MTIDNTAGAAGERPAAPETEAAPSGPTQGDSAVPISGIRNLWLRRLAIIAYWAIAYPLVLLALAAVTLWFLVCDVSVGVWQALETWWHEAADAWSKTWLVTAAVAGVMGKLWSRR